MFKLKLLSFLCRYSLIFNWKQVSVMIGYKKRISERLSCYKQGWGEVHHFVNNSVSK